MRIPRINSVMTPFPYSVEADASLDAARAMMARHAIRHLPVMDGESLVGVVSQNALERIHTSESAATARVKDVMLDDPYEVEIGEPLERVLFHMADLHLECALVVKDGRLAGIFTMIDAYRRFAEELRRQRTKGGGDDAA